MGSILGSGRSHGEGNGNPLQHSCLGNPMDRGAWWATVLRAAKSLIWLKRLSTHRIWGGLNLQVQNHRVGGCNEDKLYTDFQGRGELLFKGQLFGRNCFYWMKSCRVNWPLCAQPLSCVPLFATPWTVALQAPLSMGSSRQEYWSGLPCPSPNWPLCGSIASHQGTRPSWWSPGINTHWALICSWMCPRCPPIGGRYYYPHFIYEEGSTGERTLPEVKIGRKW